MPKQGYRTITVPSEAAKELEDMAHQRRCSIAEFIYIMKEEMKNLRAQQDYPSRDEVAEIVNTALGRFKEELTAYLEAKKR